MCLRTMSSTLQVDSALKGRLERHSFAYANKRFLKIFPKQEVGEVSGCSPKAGQAWWTGKTLPWERQGGAGLDYWEGWQGREGRVWSLQIFASGITQRLSLGTHPAPHTWSGQLSLLRVYYHLTPLCQLLQSPLVSNRALSFRFPSYYC